MANKTPQGLEKAFQVRATNKMNEKIWHPKTSTNYYKDVEKGYPVL
jgi:hypothetical protein